MHTEWDLTQEIRQTAMALGADLVGIASVDRYAEAPLRLAPTGHLPDARAVVVIAIHHPDACVELGGEPTPHDQGPYAIQGVMNAKLDHIAFRLARLLEGHGHQSIAVPVTNVWRFRPYKGDDNCFTPDLSNIHAGAAAGLGQIGWSGLLVTPEFGPRQRLCCVVTAARLAADPLYDGPPLCDRCDACVTHCPTGALSEESSGELIVRIGDTEHRYCNKNKWRCAWAEHFGLSIDLPLPSTIDEHTVLDTLAAHGRRGGAFGSCLRFCMPSHLRVADPAYSRAPRRRRITAPRLDLGDDDKVATVVDRRATEAAIATAFSGGADMVGVVTGTQLPAEDMKLTEFLPDAEAAVVFGIGYAASLCRGADSQAPGREAAAALSDRMGFAELAIARGLEDCGYSALPHTEVCADLLAAAAGLGKPGADGGLETPEYGARQMLGCVITSAPLRPTARKRERHAGAHRMGSAKLATELIRELRYRGADLVGIVPAARVAKLAAAWRSVADEEPFDVEVRDAGPSHGAVKPVIERTGQEVFKEPQHHLPAAASVLVIGVHHPTESLARAGEPPSEAVGPYAAAAYQTRRELGYLAIDAVRLLDRAGYEAAISTDLTGSATVVASPRGPQPDARANRFAAVAAGLGHVGWHGAVITPQYGVTQRFIAVVTDAVLPPTSVADLAHLCTECDRPCVRACPVGALSPGERVQLECDGVVHQFGCLDVLRCDWAKRYALVGAAGPAYMGSTTDIAPPEGAITPEDIARALEQQDPLQKHWTCILEGCLKACHLWLRDWGKAGTRA